MTKANEKTYLVEEESGDQEVTWTKGEKQESACHDVFFAILFIAMVAIVAVAAGKAPKVDTEHHLTQENIDGFVKFFLSSAGIAVGVSGIALLILVCLAEYIISISILSSIVASIAVAITSWKAGNTWGVILSLSVTLLSICYYCMIQNRIALATANIRTGTAATEANSGIYLVGLFFVALTIGWLFLWSTATIGVLEGKKVCDDYGTRCHYDVNFGWVFLLLLSLYWAIEVFTNATHVTVAGVIGTWWYAPEEANSCCSSAVTDSLMRTMTSSFGSICFGSLLIAILQALRGAVNSLRDQDENEVVGCILCILECILACFESFLDYFTKYAFIYIGVYGYNFLDSGKYVNDLFIANGLTMVINDNLVGSALNFMALTVSFITGWFGLLLDHYHGDWLAVFDASTSSEHSAGPAFLFSFVAGFVVARTIMSIISSAVNAVIVLFAESPADFEQNYPDHSREMREAWFEVYGIRPDN